jgi:histidinol dehydrogenase
VAADLLAQAEHDPLAAAILLTTDLQLAQQVQQAVATQMEAHPNRLMVGKVGGELRADCGGAGS